MKKRLDNIPEGVVYHNLSATRVVNKKKKTFYFSFITRNKKEGVKKFIPEITLVIFIVIHC